MSNSEPTPGSGEPQKLSVLEALIPIAVLIALVALSYYLFGDAGASGPNQIALIVSLMVAVVIAARRGHSLASLHEAAVASVSSGLGAIFILLAVGALIGAWAMSGTLLAMVYYGLQILHPDYFYVTAALVCAIVSASIGSSWTTAGTIGVGLMGIAANLDLNPAIAAAAIISGSYFGDTTSPLSDSANLAAGAAGTDLYTHIREMAPASALALLLALIVYWLLGQPGDFDASEKINAIRAHFNMSPILFLPLVVVGGLALLKFPPFTAIFYGALAGGLLAAIDSPERVIAYANARPDVPSALAVLKGVWLALAEGYKSQTGFAPIDTLVSRGGMASMLNTIWLVIAALAFGGVMEKTGALHRLIQPIIDAVKSVAALIAAMVGAVIATNIVTADQYLAVILPARLFKAPMAKLGFAPYVLSRTVGAAATPTSALVPWNSCGAYMAATLGVPTLAYAPFAVFSIACPLIVIAMALLGARMTRRSNDGAPVSG